jgi:hypothetical protein
MFTGRLQSDAARILHGYYRNALGGSASWDAIESIRFDGIIMQPEGNVRFFAFKKKPDYCKVIVELPGGGRAVMAYDGEDAWMQNTLVDPAPVDMDPLEAQNFIRDAATGGHLLYPVLPGKSVRYLGTADVGEHPCYEMEVTLPNGQMLRYFLDFGTFAERRQITVNAVNGLEEITTRTDFQRFDGALFPIFSRMETGGKLAHKIEIDRVQTNIGLMPWMFQRPSGASMPGENQEPRTMAPIAPPEFNREMPFSLEGSAFPDLNPEERQSILEDIGKPLSP